MDAPAVSTRWYAWPPGWQRFGRPRAHRPCWLTLPGRRPVSPPAWRDPSGADMSVPQERKFGESIMRQIRLSGAYLSDPEVNGYLNELGNRLVTAIPGAPFDFEFFAVGDPSINAFALPGGFVGINTGLILLCQSESEL